MTNQMTKISLTFAPSGGGQIPTLLQIMEEVGPMLSSFLTLVKGRKDPSRTSTSTCKLDELHCRHAPRHLERRCFQAQLSDSVDNGLTKIEATIHGSGTSYDAACVYLADYPTSRSSHWTVS